MMEEQVLNFTVAFLISFITGFITLKILKKFLIKRKIHYFSYYLFTFAIIIIILDNFML